MDELETAVQIGEMVREKPKEHMAVLVNKIMAEGNTKGAQIKTAQSGCG